MVRGSVTDSSWDHKAGSDVSCDCASLERMVERFMDPDVNSSENLMSWSARVPGFFTNNSMLSRASQTPAAFPQIGHGRRPRVKPRIKLLGELTWMGHARRKVAKINVLHALDMSMQVHVVTNIVGAWLRGDHQ
jgi:hypothetical protein